MRLLLPGTAGLTYRVQQKTLAKGIIGFCRIEVPELDCTPCTPHDELTSCWR